MKITKGSVISRPSPILNSALFNSQGYLHQGVRLKILNALKNILKSINIKDIRYIWIVGSSITYQYDNRSDIDVNIAVKHLNKDQAKELNTLLDHQFNGKIKVGGLYPVNYYIVYNTFAYQKSEAIYDLYNNHWIKKPHRLAEEDVRSLIASCLPSKILTELIETYLSLANLYAKYFELEITKEQNNNLDKEIIHFINVYNTLKQQRRDIHSKKTKHSISKECIAVVFKIAESLGLGQLYKALNNIYNESQR